MNTDENDKIFEFEEKPKNPKNNLASMGIYIFTWEKLRQALIDDNKIHQDSDFGKHIIPAMLGNNQNLYAYRFDSYWKDVGTIESYWSANMELVKALPNFNLYEDFWKIYTCVDHQVPEYIGDTADINTCIISEGCEIYGQVYNCVLGYNVIVEEGAFLKDSIVMANSIIKKNSVLDRCIIDENVTIGENVKIGVGDNIVNVLEPKIYNTGISVIGGNSSVPDNVTIGKNCVVFGDELNFQNNCLESGQSLIMDKVKL